MKHVFLDVVSRLPAGGDAGSGGVSANNGTQGVIESDLVIKVVKAGGEVVAVLRRVIYLSNEKYVGMFFLHGSHGVAPESSGHHLRHVAAEGIDSFFCPEEQDVRHLFPGGGSGGEVGGASALIVNAIVQLHRFIPVIS